MNLFLVFMLFCDIKGEVKNPDVYEINNNTNINDVIIKAGGLNKNAVTSHINLSKNVTDEMVIYIPHKNDYKSCSCNCETKFKYVDCEKKEKTTTTSAIKITTVTFPQVTTITVPSITTLTVPPITTSIPNMVININTASLEELISLNGIGKVTANKIIEYRIENPFSNIEEIKKVSGIGEIVFAQIKDFITV